MKTNKWIILITIGITSILYLTYCKKNNIPVINTEPVTNITASSAISGGNIINDGGETVFKRGVCWSKEINPSTNDNTTSDGAGAGSFSSTMTGLSGGTTYYVRAYATNNTGTGYGMTLSFTSLGSIPTATTKQATNIEMTSAVLNGIVNANLITTNVSFEYGISLSYGQTVPATQSPLIGNSNISVSAKISGLISFQEYHFRVKSENSLGTVFGSDNSFTPSNLLIDIDGNNYKIVTIGTQVWMAENLKTVYYNNGDPIPFIVDNNLWTNATTGGYSWYNNDEVTYKTTYGALYHSSTVLDSRNVCPVGWHVPSNDEWSTLETYLGGINIAGSKLKEVGTLHWISPNNGATNESGFTGLPGGYRSGSGIFDSFGIRGCWWSSTSYSSIFTWGRNLTNQASSILKDGYNNGNGFSIRCIKD